MDESQASDPQVEARHQMLAWLTLVFRDPQELPVEDLARAEVSSWASSSGTLTPELPELNPEEGADLRERLASEYVRLFVNSMGAPVAHLEAAAYLEEMGPERQSSWLAELRDALQSAGYEAEGDRSRPIDHLSLLLEYLYRENPDSPSASTPFAQRFLLPWLPTMLERLAAARPHPFYERGGRVLASCFDLEFPSVTGAP